MLIQNPQLAYALLQALVVMRAVDPNAALTMLQKGPQAEAGMGMPPQHYPKPGFPMQGGEQWGPVPRPDMVEQYPGKLGAGNLSKHSYISL